MSLPRVVCSERQKKYHTVKAQFPASVILASRWSPLSHVDFAKDLEITQHGPKTRSGWLLSIRHKILQQIDLKKFR